MEDFADNFQSPETLDELGPGLTVQLVHGALMSGEAAANSCTANDVPVLAGFLRWARTMRGLRDALAQHGWRRSNVKGLPMVVSPDGKIAIAVSTGDEGTGTEADSKTKYGKGKAAETVVAWNQLTFLAPGFDNDGRDDDEIGPPDRATWYLLFAKVGEEIRAELSLPSSIGTDGKVEGMTRRYRLPVLALHDVPPQPADDEPSDVVEVTRR